MITLSAYNPTEAVGRGRSNRLRRLARTADYIYKHMTDVRGAISALNQEALLLTRLHDHKGQLTATYSAEPSVTFKSIVERAWDKQREHDVVHKVSSE